MSPFDLGADEVHVWWAELDLPVPALDRLRSILAADELARAEQQRFPVDRCRQLAARGILRLLLSAYLGLPPQDLHLEAGPAGKPRLADQAVQFNVSHAGALGLYAVARSRPVGVDVEAVRADFPAVSVARLVFSAAELAAWQALPACERDLAFFQLWTRKEAYAKAQGEGLALALKTKTLGWQAGFQDEAWSLVSLPAEPGYTAALAAAGRGWHSTVRRWPSGGNLLAVKVGSPDGAMLVWI